MSGSLTTEDAIGYHTAIFTRAVLIVINDAIGSTKITEIVIVVPTFDG